MESAVVNVLSSKVNTNVYVMNEHLHNILNAFKEEELYEVHLNLLYITFKYKFKKVEKMGFLNLKKLRPNQVKRHNRFYVRNNTCIVMMYNIIEVWKFFLIIGPDVL